METELINLLQATLERAIETNLTLLEIFAIEKAIIVVSEYETLQNAYKNLYGVDLKQEILFDSIVLQDELYWQMCNNIV